jgi:hypothetical protein
MQICNRDHSRSGVRGTQQGCGGAAPGSQTQLDMLHWVFHYIIVCLDWQPVHPQPHCLRLSVGFTLGGPHWGHRLPIDFFLSFINMILNTGKNGGGRL